TSGGNVGIGTTTPGYLLSIEQAVSGDTIPEMVIKNTNNSARPRVISEDANTAATWDYQRLGGTAQQWSAGLGANTGGTGFEFLDVTGGQVEMTITTAGNVTITGNCSDAAGGGGCTADYAEVYQRDVRDNSLAMTDILALDTTTGKVTQANKAKGKTTLLGVYSTAPGTLIGQRKNSIDLGIGKGVMDNLDPDEIPVALVGRVPTKVSLEGGDIKIGDPIGLSSVPGTGMKVKSGQSIGIALQPFPDPLQLPLSKGREQTATIEVFVRLSYLYDESYVPIWDGKIDNVLTEIRDLKKRVDINSADLEKLKQEVKDIKRKK
ncbi:MAG: hypothetical protein AAB642_03860, partial [Patescibacteria group bacterium]